MMFVKLLIVSCIILQTVDAKGTILSEEAFREDLNKTNKLRKRVADTYGISNMHELTWDYELAEIVSRKKCGKKRKDVWNTGKMTDGPGRVVPMFLSRGVPKGTKSPIGEYIREALNDTLSPEETVLLSLELYLHPTQTSIGCARFTDCTVKDPSSDDVYIIATACLMGPSRLTWKEEMKNGTAGRDCGTRQKGSLCVSASKTVKKPTGESSDEDYEDAEDWQGSTTSIALYQIIIICAVMIFR